MDINYLINLKPETAIAYLKSKGYKISFDWREVWQEAHHKAFTVAKAMNLDILQTIRQSTQTALEQGQTLHQFRETLKPELQKKGWWGKKEVEDPNTGEVKEVMLGSPHRLQTIYRTNLNVAYKVGQYKEQIENIDDRPYWMYEATLDSNTRPEHRALHGKVFRADDPIWDSIYPPNDWGCRCTVRPLNESQLKEKELSVEKTGTKIPDNFQPKEWAYNPGKDAFYPDYDKYSYDIASAAFGSELKSDYFDPFFDGLIKGNLPVAILEENLYKLINAKTNVVKLSAESLSKNKQVHPDITIQEYKSLPLLISKASLIVKDGGQTMVFIKHSGVYYHSVVKSTRSGGEVFLTSFRHTNLEDIKRIKAKGKIIKDEM